MFKTYVSTLVALWLAGMACAATLYVDGSVPASGDGSLAAPFKTIGQAIAASVAGDQIKVAGGLYYNEPPDMAIKSQQVISGSYDSAFTSVNFADNPTIIDMGRLTEQEQDRTFRCRGTSSFVLENIIIQNSTTGEWADTDNGGAIYIQSGSSGTIRRVWFINCNTKFEGGVETGPAREGGALCIRDASTVTIEDCVFDGCTAVGGGGAIRIRNAGAGNNVKIHRCVFTNCGSRNGASTIDDGDGVSQIEIVNCLFVNNGVDVKVPSGIAPSNYEIRVADRQALIYNCTFIGSNNPNGFMFNLGNSSDPGANKHIINCIISNNIIPSTATSAIFGYAVGYDDTTRIENNLFFSNSGLDPLDPSGAGVIDTNGNIAGEPQFVDPDNGDYHLKADSPGVDAGQTLPAVTVDLEGRARPAGAAYDIGALEGQGGADPFWYQIQGIVATASSSLAANSGPEKTVDGSGLNPLGQHDTAANHMWTSATGQAGPVWIQYEFDTLYKLNKMLVWNSNSDLEWLLGWGVRSAIVEYSTDGVTWTALGGVPEFARAPGTPNYAANTTVDFGGVAARFVRITCTSSWGGNQYGLSEVKFLYFPVQASRPKPVNGARAVPVETTLSWKAGREAAVHKVYLGTDPDALALVATTSTTSYAPAGLLLGTQYYWRVDEVNQAQIPAVWTGQVWSFTTAEHAVVDDFEAYTNSSPNRVFQTWIDGLGFSADQFFPNGKSGNGTGAIVGYDPAIGNIMETSIVHGGRQSMPLAYDGPSETTRTFDPPQDWTRSGIKTLVLYFYGLTHNVTGQLYVKINGTKVPYNGDAGDLAAGQWIQWNIALPPGAGLGAVNTLTIGLSGGKGTLLIDDIRLYQTAP